MNRTLRYTLLMTPALLASAAMALTIGPEWPEGDDAGDCIAVAQIPLGFGAMRFLRGDLDGFGPATLGCTALLGDEDAGTTFAQMTGDFQDVYLIHIQDADCFEASMRSVDGGSATFNAEMFLFNTDSRGEVGNDDFSAAEDRPRLKPDADDGSGFSLIQNGLYYLSISGFNSNPAEFGLLIFDQATPTEISGPDGPVGSGQLNGWSAFGQSGAYRVALEGVVFPPTSGAPYRLCPADCAPDNGDCTYGNDVVNIDDLLAVINVFGGGRGRCDVAPVSFDGANYGNGVINFDDILAVINAFGPCP